MATGPVGDTLGSGYLMRVCVCVCSNVHDMRIKMCAMRLD
jgi:hypothetical protein